MNMDEEFEAGLLNLIDTALSLDPSESNFRAFEKAYQRFESSGTEQARVISTLERDLLPRFDLFDFPPQFVAALDELMPRERRDCFVEITDELARTLWDDVTDQDRKDGYRTLAEFFAFLREWREGYRNRFSR
jgi:hypothetical protein